MNNPIPLIKALAKPDQAMVTEAVNDWLDDHPEATTTVQDGAITKAKLNTALQNAVDSIPAVDATLVTAGAAADAQKTGDKLSDLKSQIDVLEPAATSSDVGKALVAKTVANGKVTQYEFGEAGGGGSGLTSDIKAALLACFKKVAWIDDEGQDYYDALEAALYPPANLVSISAVYTQSGTVYSDDTLDSLQSDLVVTAHYVDGTSATVTAYTLSGSLSANPSTITVAYGGKTTTFTVNVTIINYLYKWDFKKSLTDSVQSAVATLTSNLERDATGVKILNRQSAILLPSGVYGYNRRIEIDFKSGEVWSVSGNAGTGGNGTVIGFGNITDPTVDVSDSSVCRPLNWRGSVPCFEMYILGSWYDVIDSEYSGTASLFAGKTMYLNIGGTGLIEIGYISDGTDVRIGKSTVAYSTDNGTAMQIGRGSTANQGMFNYTVEAIRVISLS